MAGGPENSVSPGPEPALGGPVCKYQFIKHRRSLGRKITAFRFSEINFPFISGDQNDACSSTDVDAGGASVVQHGLL